MSLHRLRFTVVAAAVALLAPVSADANLVVEPTMTRRDDRADGLYSGFASMFPGVGLLGGGSGTLIAPDWVITAAHVVGSSPASSNTFVIGGASYTGSAVFIAPGWNGNLYAGNDLALLRLSTSVTNIAPVPYNASPNEVGHVADISGFGYTGTGTTGYAAGPRTQRAGENVVDATADALNSPGSPPDQTFTDRILVTDFDNPNSAADNLLGSGDPLDLEMNVAPGDSGGGLFIDFGRGWVLSGVTSFLASDDGTDDADYGDVSGFTRTSSWASFIQTTTGVAPAAAPEPSSAVLLLLVAAAGGASRLRDRQSSPPSSAA